MSVDWFVASRGRRLAVRAWALHLVVTVSLAVAGSVWVAAAAEAKSPGRTYCFLKKCHRVKTIAETQALIGRDMTVIASHYDDCKKDRFNPCGLTSSGEPFFPERADNAASPVLPDGTIVMVWSKASKEALVLRINNAGPYWGHRKLDLSRAAARKLRIGGVGEVTMRVLKAPTPAEARYSRNRRYERVPGPIGQFASLDEAHGAMATMVAEGKTDAFAVADLAVPAKRDASADLSTALKSPILPGFAIPRDALADALIAQSKIEQRVVTAGLPPLTDIVMDVAASAGVAASVTAVTPKLKAARIVAPRRTRVRAIEVKPIVSDPLTVIAQAVTDLFDPPKAKRPVRSHKPARKAAKAVPAPKKIVVAAAKPRRVARVTVARVAKPAPSAEFRAGHTTYAEDRFRKTVAIAKPKKKSRVAAVKGKSVSEAATGTSVKQAGVNRGKKSAALRKKAGGWQSSAVGDVPEVLPSLTGPTLRIPADHLWDERELPRGPLRRVQPSTLV